MIDHSFRALAESKAISDGAIEHESSKVNNTHKRNFTNSRAAIYDFFH